MVFLKFMFEYVHLISSGILFHKTETMKDKALWPMLVLRNECLSL